jgi:hypothetical protein
MRGRPSGDLAPGAEGEGANSTMFVGVRDLELRGDDLRHRLGARMSLPRFTSAFPP